MTVQAGRNPYVFVLGCPRSGTTLLRRMLNAHPELAITPETHWIPEWFDERRGVTPNGDVTREFVSTMLEADRVKRLKVQDEDVLQLFDSADLVPYARVVARVFDLFGDAHGKPLVGDKTPGYTTAISTLHGLFPSARFLHLIRDGRDVCLSVNNWQRIGKLKSRFPSWREEPVSVAAYWWELHVRAARQAGACLEPGLYTELRYEELVGDPSQALIAVCEFLGLPYDDAVLRFHEGRTRPSQTRGSNKLWLPPTPGLRDWRTEMPADDVARFEGAVGELLNELEYPTTFPRVGNGIRDAFAEDLRARGWAVPEHWST